MSDFEMPYFVDGGNKGYFKDTTAREQIDNKQDTLTFDNVPTQNSDNPVKSGGIFSTMDAVKDKLITENWTSGKLTDTSNFTFNGFTGTISNGWIYYSKSKSAIIINIFMYITNAVFTNINNPYIDIKLPNKAKYSFDRLFAGVFGTGATVQDVYSRRAEDVFITVNENSDTIRLLKHNFVQGATDGVVIIVTPEIIIPIV